jgi:hypothetical protein
MKDEGHRNAALLRSFKAARGTNLRGPWAWERIGATVYPARGPSYGPKGHESIAQASAGLQPGFYIFNGTALTRRYLVAPCWKNTRSAGLEVLKGRRNRLMQPPNKTALSSRHSDLSPKTQRLRKSRVG